MRLTDKLLFLPLCIFFLYLLPLEGYSQFREIYKEADPANHITGMSFISPSTGYVAFTKNIGFTQDSGKTYIRRTISYANTNFNGYPVGLTFGFTPHGVLAFSADSLLVYGDFSFEPSILFSSNGGQSWKVVFHRGINPGASQFSEGVTDIEFPGNGAVGYAVHHEGILKTFNRGQTWVTLLNMPNELLRKLSCPSPNVAYISGGGKLYKTANAGSLWTNMPPPANNTYPNFNNVHFISELIGYCTDESSGQVYKTVNGGAAWVRMNEPAVVSAGGNDMHFINDSTGFLATNLYWVYKTTDHGKTWERCKSDKAPIGDNNGLNALYFLNSSTGWAGGAGGRLLLNKDGITPTFPQAYFKVDMTNMATTGVVNLINYSKPGYNYSWSKNGQFLSSAYHTSYTHGTSLRDTIELIVWNGSETDTLVQYVNFNQPIVITSFSPEVAYEGMEVTIRGNDFLNVESVSFGGVPTGYFRHRSLTEIVAIVGKGASGDVRVATPTTSGSKSGFIFLSPPKIDLNVSVQDTMLCKAESAIVIVPNSEADVQYVLWDTNKWNALGSGKGNGGELRFPTVPISQSGTYYVWATRSLLSTSLTRMLTKGIRITVEHTRSVFAADKINASVNEPVNYANYSIDAATFAWSFSGSASIGSSSSSAPANVSYASGGPKTLTLISTSSYGCSDTLTGNAVFVYNNPVPEEVCYANNIEDEDSYELPGKFHDMRMDIGGDYIICGMGNNPLIKSRYGVPKKLEGGAVSHLSKYTKDGILRWVDYVVGGYIKSAVADSDGNIYITGMCYTGSWFHFNNGDSMLFAPKSISPAYDKLNGFVMKVNAAGKYLWHTLIFDPSPLYQGYPVQGGNPSKIVLQGDQLVIIGSSLANLSYNQNGVITPIVAYRNSVYENDNQNKFVLSISTNGNYNWSSYAHNGATNHIYDFSDAVIDASGNTYVSAYYEGLVELYSVNNNNPTFYGSNGSANGYLLKYDRQGNLIWHVRLTNASTVPKCLALDGAGMVYMLGASRCSSASDYFVVNNTDGTTMQGSYGGYFLLKITPAGKAVWTQGSKYSYYGSGSAIHFDGTNINIGGVLSNNGIDLSRFVFTSAGGDVTNFPIYESEFFLARYDVNGTIVKLSTSGQNAGGHITPTRMFTDSKGNLLLGGFTDPYNGGTGQNKVFNSIAYSRGEDAFYAKINPDFCSAGITIYPKAGADTLVCAGSTVTLGINNPAGYTYFWRSGDGSFTATTPFVTVVPARNTTYYVSLTNVSGVVTHDTVIVNVFGLPTANAGVDKDICVGSNVSIGITATGNTYQWSSLPAGFTSSLANPAVSPLVNTQYFLAVKNASGCMAYDTVIVNVNTSVADAGADKVVCIGSSVMIGAAVAGDTYVWTSQPAGFTSSTANPFVSPLVNTRYFLKVTNASGCVAYDTVDVNITGVPVASAGPDKEICAGTNVSIGVAGAGQTYQWTSLPAGFSSSLANPSVAPLVNTRYFLAVRNAAGCMAYDTVDVRVIGAPVANAGVDKSICVGSSASIGIAATGDTYQWTSLPAGFTSSVPNPVVTPSGRTLYCLAVRNAAGCFAYDTVTVDVLFPPYTNAGPDKEICAGASVSIGTIMGIQTFQWTSQPAGFTSSLAMPVVSPLVNTRYFLKVTNASGCVGYDTVDVRIGNAAVAADAGPDQEVCLGGSVTVGGTAVAGNTYQWTSQPGGFTSTLANPVITPGVSVQLFLVVKSPGGCLAYDTVNVNVVNSFVANAGPDQSVCAGGSVTIGIAATAGNIYQWTSLPAGFTSSAANPVVTPTVNTKYVLLVKNAMGCFAYDTVNVTVGGGVVANAGVDKEVCAGSNVTIGMAGSGNIYQWTSQPAGFTSSIPDPVVAPTVNTRYFLKVTNASGCIGYDTVDVVAKPLPPKPSITKVVGDTLVSSAIVGNQWYIDPLIMLSGVNGQRYKPVISGLYSVQVTVNGCVSPFSDKFDFKPTVTAIRDPDDVVSASLYPNPTRDRVKVVFQVWGVRQLHAAIFDGRGRQVHVRRNVNSGDELTVSQLTAGIYTVKLFDDKNNVRIIRQLAIY